MSKIKIMYVYAGFAGGGGGEQQLLVLLKGLNRHNFDLSICVIENAREGLGPEVRKLSCPIYELNLSRRFYNPLNAIRVVLKLYRLFKKHRIHIVQTQAINANVLGRIGAKLAGVPIIISSENTAPDLEPRRIVRVFNQTVITLLDQISDKIITASHEIFKMKVQTHAPDKIVIINPSFNMDNFDVTTEMDRHLFYDIVNPMIGIVGRLTFEKGHKYLIKAMPEILNSFPSVRLLIVGSGELEGELKTQVDTLNLGHCVEFTGYVPHSLIFEQWTRVDIAVMPSVTEGFGLVALEAMVTGLPVVATRVGGMPEVIIDGETGILIPPKDSLALAQAIKYLLSHTREAREMGQRARERVFRKFHPSRYIEAHENIYEQLVISHIPGFRQE